MYLIERIYGTNIDTLLCDLLLCFRTVSSLVFTHFIDSIYQPVVRPDLFRQIRQLVAIVIDVSALICLAFISSADNRSKMCFLIDKQPAPRNTDRFYDHNYDHCRGCAYASARVRVRVCVCVCSEAHQPLQTEIDVVLAATPF